MSRVARVLLFAVRVYQTFFSALMPSACKFYPTCSHYAAEAVRLYGARRGSRLALRRLLRCHPFTRGGVDLVPDPADPVGEMGPLKGLCLDSQANTSGAKALSRKHPRMARLKPCPTKPVVPAQALNRLRKNSSNVSFRGAERRGISLFLGFMRREIPRFARNDKPGGVFPQPAKPLLTKQGVSAEVHNPHGQGREGHL